MRRQEKKKDELELEDYSILEDLYGLQSDKGGLSVQDDREAEEGPPDEGRDSARGSGEAEPRDPEQEHTTKDDGRPSSPNPDRGQGKGRTLGGEGRDPGTPNACARLDDGPNPNPTQDHNNDAGPDPNHDPNPNPTQIVVPTPTATKTPTQTPTPPLTPTPTPT